MADEVDGGGAVVAVDAVDAVGGIAYRRELGVDEDVDVDGVAAVETRGGDVVVAGEDLGEGVGGVEGAHLAVEHVEGDAAHVGVAGDGEALDVGDFAVVTGFIAERAPLYLGLVAGGNRCD